uniref:Major facilitator superfamily (MFS) profile domain-containing protein n=1 Tax=Kwoniella dejecticola CBS 10117 TaxID=1296121 RepID=A0A1A5ZX40_9TREE|nr:uncharacterized protein I303_07126 [Kwoniella dejecticola CBS 10117]OBR82367.1 hypothetical protein I303_07126 [Kwoniella dejecticola CBS 10117]
MPRLSPANVHIVVTYGAWTEAFVYMVGVPVIPFRLEDLGYTHISTKSSWFLFAYCIAISVYTLPNAILLDRKLWRRGPMIIATCAMQLSLLLLILVKRYWVMILARIIQGLSCTVIWSVGFALICENVDKKIIGRQLGIAFTGSHLGNVVGPAAGSGLYTAFGWKGPWVLCMGVCSIELLARWLVIEQKDIPMAKQEPEVPLETIPQRGDATSRVVAPSRQNPSEEEEEEVQRHGTPDKGTAQVKKEKKQLSPVEVIITLFSIPRSLTAIGVNFASGMIIGAIDPTLTLRFRDEWGKDSHFVGLVYLATIAPVLFTGVVTGHLADRFGAEWLIPTTSLLSAPFCLLMILKKSIIGFIISFGFMNLFLNCTLAPIGVEVSAVTRDNEGISELHQFAALNVAWGKWVHSRAT